MLSKALRVSSGSSDTPTDKKLGVIPKLPESKALGNNKRYNNEA